MEHQCSCHYSSEGAARWVSLRKTGDLHDAAHAGVPFLRSSSEHDCSSVIQEIADLPRSITTASITHPPESTDHGHDHL